MEDQTRCALHHQREIRRPPRASEVIKKRSALTLSVWVRSIPSPFHLHLVGGAKGLARSPCDFGVEFHCGMTFTSMKTSSAKLGTSTCSTSRAWGYRITFAPSRMCRDPPVPRTGFEADPRSGVNTGVPTAAVVRKSLFIVLHGGLCRSGAPSARKVSRFQKVEGTSA
jgi:hypothetical protein